MSKPVPRLAAYVSDIQTLEEGDVAPRTAANADKVLKPLPSDRVGMGTKTFIAKASDRGLLDKSPQAVGLRGRFPLQNRLRFGPKGNGYCARDATLLNSSPQEAIIFGAQDKLLESGGSVARVRVGRIRAWAAVLVATTTWASPSRATGGRGCVRMAASRAQTEVAHLRRARMQQRLTTLRMRLPKVRCERVPRRQRSSGQLSTDEGAIRSDPGTVLGRLLATPSHSPGTARRGARIGISNLGRQHGRRPDRLAASASGRARSAKLRGRR